MQESVFVTGGAGFIGANFILHRMKKVPGAVVNIDKLTYAGNLQNLDSIKNDTRHTFRKLDINDAAAIRELFSRYQPCGLIHFAAESHVDRSITAPGAFVETNIRGTFTLLEEARAYWAKLADAEKNRFRFIQVSTDEVYGSLTPDEPAFTESRAYSPNSPYSASKAAGDHLARAYHHTYGLPVIVTNCSNNYGPFQFPEKLIPLMVLNAIASKQLPVYGDGKNVRDWLYVEDHCEAIDLIFRKGRPGETYNVGGGNEHTNIEVVSMVCGILDELRPTGKPHSALIKYVTDRPGHDQRYAIDGTKLSQELGWKPQHDFRNGLRKTVEWYLGNDAWVQGVLTGSYQEWIDTNYAAR